jgi:hypothetical protein
VRIVLSRNLPERSAVVAIHPLQVRGYYFYIVLCNMQKVVIIMRLNIIVTGVILKVENQEKLVRRYFSINIVSLGCCKYTSQEATFLIS